MDIDSLAALVRRIREFDHNDIEITRETDLVMDLGFDSLDITELMYAIEDEIGTMIDYARLEPRHLRSIGALAAFLSESRAQDAP